MGYYRHNIKTIGQLDLIIFIQSSTRCGTSGIRCARKKAPKQRSFSFSQRPKAEKEKRGWRGEEKRGLETMRNWSDTERAAERERELA